MFVTHSLEVIRFCSRIMKEHFLFLRLGFRCGDTHLIDEANHFDHEFEKIEQRSNSLTNQTDPKQMRRSNTRKTKSIRINSFMPVAWCK